MNSDYIIHLSADKDDLEKEFEKWKKLSYDNKEIADKICYKMFGCDNIDRLNMAREIIENRHKEINTEYMNEASFRRDTDVTTDNYHKILKSENILFSDPNIVIIMDFISDDKPTYDVNFLNTQLNNYNLLTPEARDRSDQYSIEIWGKSVMEMYNYMLSKLSSIGKFIDVSPEDHRLSEFEDDYKTADALEAAILKLNTLSDNRTIYESSVLSKIVDKEPDKVDYSKYMNNVVPYFTFDEYCDLVEGARDSLDAFNYTDIENPAVYYNKVRELQEARRDQDVIKLGWNPYIPINELTINHAKVRQSNWFNLYERVNIIDISGYDTDLQDNVLSEGIQDFKIQIDNIQVLRPVYITLCYTGSIMGRLVNSFEKSEFSHAGLSLNTKLDCIYSFNFKPKKHQNGFGIESLDEYKADNKDGKLMLNVLFVTEEAYEKLRANIKYYMDHESETMYSFNNLLKIVVNKVSDSAYVLNMVCSQFVDALLKLINVDITGKSSSLVAPEDFARPKGDVKLFTLFKGNFKDYNSRTADRKVKALLRQKSYIELNAVKSADKVLDTIRSGKLEAFDIKSEDEALNSIIKEMRQCITPELAILEFKSPIGFKNNGSLYINLPKDLQAEYEEAHRLLSLYDSSDLNGIKSELARLFYLNSIIEKKLSKLDKGSVEYKELINLRARVLNDYSTYFKIIKSNEKDFDFMEYLKHTDYYNKSVEIDGATMKYTGSYIKKIAKGLITK